MLTDRDAGSWQSVAWTLARLVADNADMLTIHSLPELRSPVMLCGFSGWPDAGEAASGAIEYLIAKWAPRRFAELDAARAYVQTTHRPKSRLTGFGRRRLIWPTLACYALPVPSAYRRLDTLRLECTDERRR